MTLNRAVHPPFNKIEHIKLPNLKIQKLDNGIPVYILNGGSQEVVKLDLMVKAGALFAPHKLYAPITGLMLHEGTQKKEAHAIAETFDFYGSYFQPTIEKDMAFIGLVSIKKHFKHTLPLFSEIIYESSMPEKELKVLLERRKQKFLIDSQKTSFIAREQFNEQLFGKNHPYGMLSSEELYSEVSRENIWTFYKSQYKAANFSLIVSGKISQSELDLINSKFGQQPLNQTDDIPSHELKTSISDKPVVVTKSDAVQSSIRMGLLTINKLHPDYLGLKILVTILGGYFGSRLMKNIREEKGYTYGIHAMLVSLHNTGYMGIAADVKAEHTREAIDEIMKELIKLIDEPISVEELSLVQNYLMGEMLHMFDGPFSTSDTFKSVLQYQLDFSYFEEMKNTILAMTPELLQHLAQKYFEPDKIVTTVAGKYE